ncbi:unnamed protein product, partial [Prorocentrum cordatum]
MVIGRPSPRRCRSGPPPPSTLLRTVLLWLLAPLRHGAIRDSGRPACATARADVDDVEVENLEASAQSSSFVPRARLQSAAAAAVRAAMLQRAETDGEHDAEGGATSQPTLLGRIQQAQWQAARTAGVTADRICYSPECGGSGTQTAGSHGALAAAPPAEPLACAPAADAAPQPEGELRVPEAAEAEHQVAAEAQATAAVVSLDATCQATACRTARPRRRAAAARQAAAEADRQAAAELQAAGRQAAERRAEPERLEEAARCDKAERQ